MAKVLHFVDINDEIPKLHYKIYEEYATHWLQSNTTGWYKMMTDIYFPSSGTNAIIRISVGFEKEEDAVHFKIVWT